MKKILVTGGAGYIGSFIVRQLKEDGFEVVIVDDLSSGHLAAVEGFKVKKINMLTEKDKLTNLFREEKFDGVIHMASFIQMGESFKNPLKYFDNNLVSALNLFSAMIENGVKYVVFSSSAGVYGNPKNLPIKEDDKKVPENPYGETKLMIERILHWFDKSDQIKSVAIRYFNAAGAALDGSIGEDHPTESHLIPILIKAALEGRKATIFGNDYNTPDGTCVRDYVHVIDLAQAHTMALEALFGGGETTYYNAGVGKGYSNKEIVETIKEISKIDFKVDYGSRRPGDVDTLFAATEKIKNELGWEPKYGLREIIESALLWHKSHPAGYKK